MASAEITFERSMFVGIVFALILYGINISLYYQSVRLLYNKRRIRYRKFYIIYSSFLLLFLTIALATNCALGDLMWIDDRDVPGGPPVYYQSNISDWYNTLGTAADVAALAMADGLMLYRCFMFWRDRRWIIILPALLYPSSIAMGIIMTIDSAMPGASIFEGLSANFAISWLALTVTFNLVVTMTIIGRLLVTYLAIRDSLGPTYGMTYIDVSATLLESALPFSVLGVSYLICQALNSNVVSAFAFVWGTFVAVSPQVVIYRVALGVAWSKDTIFTTTEDVHVTSDPSKQCNTEKCEGRSSDSTLEASSTDSQSYSKEDEV